MQSDNNNNNSSSLEYKASMMQGGLLNQEKPFLLPTDFQPSKWDITIPCGWVKSKEHSGNARFLEMCQQQLENYEKCSSKVERSIVIHRIVLSVMAGSPTQTGFVNRDKTTGRWHFIGMTRARERVGYVLRRAISDKKAKLEKIKRGEPVDEPKKKKRKNNKTAANKKKQEQTGIAWRMAPSKLADTESSSLPADAGAVASKSLAIRRRKLHIALTNTITKTISGSLSGGEEQETLEQASKRQRTLPTIGSLSATDMDGKVNEQSAVISQALSIAKPSAATFSHPLLLGAARGGGGLSSSLYSSLAGGGGGAGGPNDIYLEAAIREHAAMRERSAFRESAALRELALREQAADAVLRERIAIRDAMQERLALQEESILRERIKMHEEAALRERLALQERLSKRANNVSSKQDMPVAEALAAAKAKKAGESASTSSTTGSLLTPAQRAAALGASSFSAFLSSDPLQAKYASLYPGLPSSAGYPSIV